VIQRKKTNGSFSTLSETEERALIMMMLGGGGGIGMDTYGLMLTVAGLALTFLPQMWVKNTYTTYQNQPNQRGITGQQVAVQMLAQQGITNVRVEETPGELTDHYSPMEHTVRLSTPNYHGATVSAATIAAHEVGHAIQHAKGYVPVVLRGQLAPAFGLGSQIGPLLFSGAMMLFFFTRGNGELALWLATLGAGLFGLSVIFHLVTLPVEIDASSRALKILKTQHFLTAQEMPGAQKVLTAAAFTYVAAALYSLMQLVYYIIRINQIRSNQDE
jgi:uncharacterized protein